MNEQELEQLLTEIETFLKKHTRKLDFEFEYDGDYDGDSQNNEADYVIIVSNTPSALQRIVQLRNLINNSDEFQVYDFLEEQVADQIANADDYLTVDFYIKKL